MGTPKENSTEEFDSEEGFPLPTKAKASPRPRSTKKGPGSKRPIGAQGRSAPYSQSASAPNTRELWLGAVNKSAGTNPNTKFGKGYVGRKTPSAYWTETLHKSGTMDSFSGLKMSQKKGMSYSSTSHYMRQVVGAEKTKKNGLSDSGTPRKPGTPGYKSPEEYYDEIIELKKQIQALSKDNSALRLKARRFEEDNIKKEKQVEQLLDPSKSEELRRTLGDRKPDAASVVQSLKQKILKLEHQLKDRETAYNKLQSDLKTTKVEEMKVQMDAFYREVLRLNEVKSVDSGVQKKKQPQIKETPSRLKAMQETVLRMNEKNVKLQAENKSLKEDLDRMMGEVSSTKEKQSHYEDMTKKELLSAIGKLEKRLDKTEETTSLMTDVESRGANIEGKITLEGTLAQRLDQLDKRETELLDEIKKKNTVNKRLKEDRTHYRKKVEEKQKEINSLKREIEELQAELDGFYDKDKSAVTPRRQTTPRKKSATPRDKERSSSKERSGSRSRQSSESSYNKRDVENFRQNHAAKNIQRQWRHHQNDVSEREKEERAKHAARVQEFTEEHAAKVIQRNWRDYSHEMEEQEDRIENFRENRAAKRIQRGWIDHKGKRHAAEVDDAAELLQSALRGHQYRTTNMRHWQGEDDTEDMTETMDDSDLDSAASVIQSSLRGYQHQKNYIRDSPSRGSSRRNSPSRNSRLSKASANRLDSEGEDLDEDDTESDIPLSTRRSGRFSPKQAPSGHRTPPGRGRTPSPSYKSRGRTPPPEDSDEDSDDDLIMTGTSKKFF